MTGPARRLPTVKVTLIRFGLAAIASAGLAISCFRTPDPDLRVLVGVLVVAAFLATLLFGMDAGKAINREANVSPPLRKLGAVLIFPLAIFGVIFIGAGLLLLFASVRTVELEACRGQLAGLAAVRFAVAFFMPLAGYGMLREGLRLAPMAMEVAKHKSREVTTVSVPLWFRILLLTDSIAIGTSAIAFAVVATATTCEAAAWIWDPKVSVLLAVASAALAVRIFALRRRRLALRAS